MMTSQQSKMTPGARLECAMTNLSSALSALQLAAEDLSIVDSELIGSDANRRRIVEASELKPADTAADIESHRTQAADITAAAAEVGKAAKTVKGKAGFIALALASVYQDELAAGDRARESKQGKLFREGDEP